MGKVRPKAVRKTFSEQMQEAIQEAEKEGLKCHIIYLMERLEDVEGWGELYDLRKLSDEMLLGKKVKI